MYYNKCRTCMSKFCPKSPLYNYSYASEHTTEEPEDNSWIGEFPWWQAMRESRNQKDY